MATAFRIVSVPSLDIASSLRGQYGRRENKIRIFRLRPKSLLRYVLSYWSMTSFQTRRRIRNARSPAGVCFYDVTRMQLSCHSEL
jgi:hypothetical protein